MGTYKNKHQGINIYLFKGKYSKLLRVHVNYIFYVAIKFISIATPHPQKYS
jgi:hypothetical protein